MPYIRGRYYMNPVVGDALEAAREAEAAKALIKALTAPSAAAIYKAKGLDPAW